MPEYNQAVNDPNMMAKLNSHGVPAINLASLAVLKVAKTFSDYNMNCLKTGNNLFGLEGFDQWRSSSSYNNVVGMYEAKIEAISNNWNDFLTQAQKINWSPEDRHHVIDKLNENMDMQMLRNVMKAKIQDMCFLLDFPGFNEDMKCKVAQCVIETNMAMKVNELFEFSDNFSAQLIFARFETMNLDQLKKVVASHTK